MEKTKSEPKRPSRQNTEKNVTQNTMDVKLTKKKSAVKRKITTVISVNNGLPEIAENEDLTEFTDV